MGAASRDELLNEQIWALRAVLASTEAVGAALEPLDLGRLEDALTGRSEALCRLRKSADRPSAFAQQSQPSAQGAALRRLLLELAQAVEEAEARNRAAADSALTGLREELREVRDGHRALRGYRAPSSPDARFADRRG